MSNDRRTGKAATTHSTEADALMAAAGNVPMLQIGTPADEGEA